MALLFFKAPKRVCNMKCLRAFYFFLILLAGLLEIRAAQALIRQPNGEYQEAATDLSVKVRGGYASVSRTWQADDQNKGLFRWYFNPNWADLNFTFDSIDGSVKQITRSGSLFAKTGTGVFVFDQIYFIKQTSDGWRWYDPTGNWITYDANGKITAYGDRNNVSVSFSRNSDGTINQLSDQNGQVILTYSYSGGQVSKISDYSGRSVSYQYTGGQLTKVTDALGYEWNYSYTGGLLTGKTDPNGHSTTITYSGNRVVRITDPMQYQTNYSYAYDHFKRVYTTVETSPTNVRTETHYDVRGKVIYQQIGTRTVNSMVKDGSNVEISIDERGLQTRTVYDTLRNPIQVTYPDGTTTSTTYDPLFNNVTSRTDELGVQTKYEYDAKGNLKELTEAVGYPEQRTTTYTYDQYGQRLTQTIKGMPIPTGVTPGPDDTQYQDATTTWTYDQYGNVATATDPLQHQTSFTYDVMGNAITKTDALHNTWAYQYNSRGWLIGQVDPLQHATAIGYDKVGNRTSLTDALNNTSTYAYADNDWRISVIDPLGGTLTTSYDKQGHVVKMTDADGVSTVYAYDADGRLISTTDATGNVTQMQYGDSTDGLSGLLVAMIYPTYKEVYKYDLRGRKTQTEKVLAGVNGGPDDLQLTTIGYDSRGDTVSAIDPMGRTTLVGYDALGRQVKTVDALAGTTQYSYDSRGNLLSVSDANGHRYAFSYDTAMRKLAESRPLGNVIYYAYDDVGNIITRTSPRGDRRVYTYDEAGRRTKEEQYSASSSNSSQTVVYSYNNKNSLTGYTQTGDTVSSATYDYDAKGQKISETVTYGAGPNAPRKTIQYDYYPNGLKKFFTYPDGTVVTYGYTSNNQLASVTTPDGDTIQFTGFIWNKPTQTQMPGVVRNVTLDRLQRPLEIRTQAIGAGTIEAPGGAIVMDYQYAYDAAGNVTQRITDDGKYEYAYDKLDRLTKATPPASLQVSTADSSGLPIEQYTYDAVHNRTSSAHQPGSWTYNADNQLLSYGIGAQQHTYEYDANGNTVKQVIGDPSTPSGVRTFTYNAAERLTEVADSGTPLATYQYDPMGRRIRKQIGSQVTLFMYAAEGAIAEFGEDGVLTRIYGWKPGGLWGTDPLWSAGKSTAGWIVDYYQNDQIGISQRMTNAQGLLTWRGISEAFGKTEAASISSIDNTLRYPGQYFDIEVGTSYNNYRDYDSSIGRYIQTDRLGLKAGINEYQYANSNPSRFIDPYGLEADECKCDRVKKPWAPWLGAKVNASGTAFVLGLSGSIGRYLNTYTGERCTVLKFCPLRIGVGFGISGGFSGEATFKGPWCGKDLGGPSCEIAYDAVEGLGIGGSVSLCDGFSLEGEIKGLAGEQLAVTFNYCFNWVLGCSGTPCECKK